MKISQGLLDELISHAQEDAPNECCGLIGGADGSAQTVYRAENEFASPLRYRVASQDLYRITQKEIPAAGEDLVAIYHSHTKSPAYPSQTDVNEAVGWPDALYLIVSLEDPDSPVVKGFWLKDKQISEADLDVG